MRGKLTYETAPAHEPITTTVVEALKSALDNLPDTQEIQDAYERGKNVDAVVQETSRVDLEINTLQLVRQLGFVAGRLEQRGEV